MKFARLIIFLLIVTIVVIQELALKQSIAAPTIYPTGVTINNTEKSFSGHTLFNFQVENKVILIDMQGRTINTWVNPIGTRFGPLAKPLPGGKMMALFGVESERGVGIFDWDGRLTWQFFREGWNLHHDFQPGSTYFGPAILPKHNALILAKVEAQYANIAPFTIFDDRIAVIDADGAVVWSWSTSDHFDELRISAKGKEEIFGGTNRYGEKADVYHTNSVNLLPGNRFSSSDPRFLKGNLLVSQRNTNRVFIIDRSSGTIAWWLMDCPGASQKSIGQHHATMIPRWLPGAGNILFFDNGGAAGYPEQNRYFTRVREINPATCEFVWEYNATHSGLKISAFFSRARGSAQRLPNGNTLISEPTGLRTFEVTVDGEIVWEYVHPTGEHAASNPEETHMYRAYRVSPDWQDSEGFPVQSGKRGYRGYRRSQNPQDSERFPELSGKPFFPW